VSAESIPADWDDVQAMRVTAEMALDAAEGRKLRFKAGPGGEGDYQVPGAAGEEGGDERRWIEAGETGGSGWIFVIVTWW
jgi:hypothetical protein